jgi:DNA-binding SARP family transcriptional activator
VLRARLFGALSAEVGGRPVPAVPGFKARSLFAYLLLHPGRHPRVRLAGTFWPDVPDTRARASLRVALFGIRQALDSAGGGAYLSADRLTAGLSDDLPRDLDVERFQRLLTAGDQTSLAAAVTAYRGPLLADLPDEWVLGEQDGYRTRVADACEQLSAFAKQEGDLVGAAEWARRGIGYEPLRESCHQALVLALAAAGRSAEALAAYRRCAAVLSAELGVAPSAALQELGTRLRSVAESAEPPVRPSPARPAGPLLGREDELVILRGWWRAAVAGGPLRFGLVTGEGGIGKTRLTAELAAFAAAQGARVATGSGLELAGAPPFAPWSEILRDLVRQTPAPSGTVEWPDVLARLIPAVSRYWGRAACPPSPAPELERARLFEAVGELVAWTARDRPVLLVLDDLHLADAASMALLAYLGRRLPEQSAFVLGTRRGVPASARLDATLEGLDRRGILAPELVLAPLPAPAVRAIVAGAAPALGDDELARLVTASDGNPLLARHAARAVAQGGQPPDGLRAMVRGPLSRLAPSARLLVDISTAAARPLEPAEAADLLGTDTLADALRSDNLGELLDLAADERIRFGHSLLRDACYQELAPPRRARLHARIAEALAQRSDRSAAEVARHHRLAGEPQKAGAYLMVAAQDARALGALSDASALLREAAEVVAGEPAKEAEAWLTLADIEAWRGNRADWEEASDRGCALLTAIGDTVGLVEAIASRGRWLRTTLCHPRESLVAHRRALQLLDEYDIDGPELRALALAGAAWTEAIAGDPTKVEPLAAACERIPEAAGDPSVVLDLAAARSTALIRVGRMVEAEAGFEEAARHADRVGRPDLATLMWNNSASVAACRGDFRRSLEYSQRAQASGSAGPFFDIGALAGQAHALSRLGRHDEALAAADLEAGVAVRSGLPEYEAAADYDRGVVALNAGRGAEAVRHLDAALSLPHTRYFSRPLARLLLAQARLSAGDLPGADRELDAVPAEPVAAADVPDTLVARMAWIEGLLAAGRGDPPLALDRITEAEQIWRRRLGSDVNRGDGYAVNLVDLGRPPVAGLIEPHVELCRVLVDKAAVLSGMGSHERSTATAAEAAALADAAGFAGYRSGVEGAATISGA